MDFKSQIVWDEFYKLKKKQLIYPDENLVRIIENNFSLKWQAALDFGCGNGRHLLYLKQKGILNLYGFDFSREVIQKNQTLYSNIHFYYYENTQSLPFKDKSVDLIICWGVLHYNPPHIRKFLLKEFYRILKPSGIFVGTYRAKQDTYFFYSEVKKSEIYFFDKEDIMEELNPYFKKIQLGYMERTPLGKLEQKIAHYFFYCEKK